MTERTVGISHLATIKNFSTDFSCFEKDYVFSRISPGTNANPGCLLDNPWRFDGLTFVLALKGIKTININLESIDVPQNSAIITGPNSIISTGEVDWNNIEAYTLFISKEFMFDINLDVNVINIKHQFQKRKPVVALTEDETQLLRRYLELLHLNAKGREVSLYVKSIARNLVSALVYEIMEIATTRDTSETEDDSQRYKSRRLSYVHDFMQLVNAYHTKERSVGFYAEKLYISPKYLSLIIKESTGKSAAQWIDECVILEAKNMLRFSGKNIQQIAYELNFTNQSSFGKFFKHLTGMSPTEFQRS
ncbi:MAG: helix-turn-helix domain-containing protein [Muribaculum sp.]|nr:helix-turn-helix domain-containing protein [Muribaculum sp.]